MLRISTKRWRTALVAVACAAGVGAGAALPGSAVAAYQCHGPTNTYSVGYDGKGNFYTVYRYKFTAEVCHDGEGLHLTYTHVDFTPYPGWTTTELGRSGDGVRDWFWDSKRYGGTWTIWADEVASFGIGSFSYPEKVYFRIWVKPDGQLADTYGGL